MALASHTQSHETGNKTEETSSPMDAEIDNPRQAAQSESIPGSESSEENSSATDTEDNNTRQYPQSGFIPGSDSSEQENTKSPRKASYWNHYVWIHGLVRSSLSVQKQLALWKSSMLPFLYHGIDNDKVAVPDGKDVVTVSAMEMDAKGAEVRLEESERGRFLFR